MAERIVSPGVFTREIDQSFLPAGVSAIGAAIIGPTAKGPAGIPTRVTSYSEYVNVFGDVVESGSGASADRYKYMTSYAVQEYLKYADSVLVTRILAGSPTVASSQVSSSTSVGLTFASGSVTLAAAAVDNQEYRVVNGSTTYRFVASGNPIPSDSTTGNVYFFSTGSTAAATVTNLVTEINNVSGIPVTAVASSTTFILSGSAAGTRYNGITFATSSATDATTFSPQFTLAGGTDTTTTANTFKLYTLSEGAILNSSGPEGTNNVLASGSVNNYRWEVSNVNTTKGTFSLSIRRGDDTINRKSVLEQYNNVTLDPNSNNYIAKVIGDQVYTVRDSGTTSPFLQLSGSFPNKSKLVRVEVQATTLNYLDANGVIRLDSLSGSLPQAASGTFANGSDGTVAHPIAWNDDITNTNTQGFNLANAAEGKTAYEDAINLLSNQDEYDFNLLVLPGLVDNYSNHATVLTKALNMVQDRGDAFLVIDPVEYGASLSTAKTKADSRDSSYAGMYWPWVQIPDTDLGKNVWVPASTLIPGVFAFNDRTAAEWFAPAGFNRGGIDIAIQAERKLTHSNRDDLYDSNVNPIATFPNSGVVVFGQKTLQKKASALDRINVRRLLIAAKKFIASSSKFLVFEQNTSETRNRFLNIANPYFENVQQRQGLYAFKVVMDDTNNTADVIDRNELRGQIFLQPTKTAEFIVIDFNVLPTGASFPE